MSTSGQSPTGPHQPRHPVVRRRNPIPGYIAIAVATMWAHVVIAVVAMGLLLRWLLVEPEPDTDYWFVLLGVAIVTVGYAMLARQVWQGKNLARRIAMYFSGALLAIACLQSLDDTTYLFDILLLSSAGVVLIMLMTSDSARYCQASEKKRE